MECMPGEEAQVDFGSGAPNRSLQTLREKLTKIGAKVVKHARYVTFQMVEVMVSRSLFHDIL